MNEETMNPGTTGLSVTESMKSDLLTAAKWTKFLCIIGCIGTVLLVLVSIILMIFGSFMGTFTQLPYGAAIGVLYLIIAALYIYPIIKGFQFANGTKAACLTDDENELARGFSGLSALLRFMGIITIIIMVLYVLIIFGAFITAVMLR